MGEKFSVFSVQPGSKERARHFTLSALRFPVSLFILYTSSFILLPSLAGLFILLSKADYRKSGVSCGSAAYGRNAGSPSR